MSDYGNPLPKNLLVSVIIDTFYRPNLLKRAVKCILSQTYENIEVVLVSNGATPETIDYLAGLDELESKVSVFYFKENQFSWDDPHLLIRECYNAGLKIAKGDIVFYQSDDDWVAEDFIERMVNLFLDNPKCTTAIGRVVNCLYDGTIINMYPVKKRNKYIDGRMLALDFLNGSKSLVQPNPGHSFAIKRDILLRYGGFQDTFETHQMLGIVPFGETGFDEEALMFWGRGPVQLNNIMNKKNFFWGSYFINNILDSGYSMIKQWSSHYDETDVEKVKHYLNFTILQSYYKVIFTEIFNFRFNFSRKIGKREKEYINTLPLNFAALNKGLEEAIVRSATYGLISLMLHGTKTLIKSPVGTVKKIVQKFS